MKAFEYLALKLFVLLGKVVCLSVYCKILNLCALTCQIIQILRNNESTSICRHVLLTCSSVFHNNTDTKFPCCLAQGMKNCILEDELVFV